MRPVMTSTPDLLSWSHWALCYPMAPVSMVETDDLAVPCRLAYCTADNTHWLRWCDRWGGLLFGGAYRIECPWDTMPYPDKHKYAGWVKTDWRQTRAQLMGQIVAPRRYGQGGNAA